MCDELLAVWHDYWCLGFCNMTLLVRGEAVAEVNNEYVCEDRGGGEILCVCVCAVSTRYIPQESAGLVVSFRGEGK